MRGLQIEKLSKKTVLLVWVVCTEEVRFTIDCLVDYTGKATAIF